jgi:hypothetical protein
LFKEWLRLAKITGISQFGQHEGDWPKVLPVEIHFRRSVDTRIGDLESEQRRERLGLDPKLKGCAFLNVRPDSDSFF